MSPVQERLRVLVVDDERRMLDSSSGHPRRRHRRRDLHVRPPGARAGQTGQFHVVCSELQDARDEPETSSPKGRRPAVLHELPADHRRRVRHPSQRGGPPLRHPGPARARAGSPGCPAGSARPRPRGGGAADAGAGVSSGRARPPRPPRREEGRAGSLRPREAQDAPASSQRRAGELVPAPVLPRRRATWTRCGSGDAGLPARSSSDRPQRRTRHLRGGAIPRR